MAESWSWRHGRPPPAPHGPRRESRPVLRHAVDVAASSAGRARRQAAADAPGRAAEGQVGDRREALLVGAQGEQEVGDAVGRRQVRSSTWTHQQCTRPAGVTSSAPASPTSQTPSAPRSRTRPVRACSSRASWPTRSPSRPSAVRSAASPARGARAQHVGAALGVQLRDRPRVGEQDRADRRRQRLEREQDAGGGDVRDRVGDGGQRPQPAAARRAAARRPAAASRRRRSRGAALARVTRRRSGGAG